MVIWYIFTRFGMLHQDKSGNPGKLWNKEKVANYSGKNSSAAWATN
jgi:hypothetical protein